MKNFDPKYNDIPKTEIHCHLEGAIRTQTIIDVAKENNIQLPAYEVQVLDKHVKVLDQMKDLQAVLDAFDIFQRSITSPAVFERIAWELFEDCAKQNIKLFEVRFSPDWAFHGHNLDWDACLEGLLRAQERAEKEFDMAIGIIAITSRGMGADSCIKTVDWAIKHQQYIQAVDLADGEKIFSAKDFIKPILKAKDAGLKVTIHSGEDTPAEYVIETIKNFKPDRIGHGIHSIEDMRAVEMLIEKDITLEVNPWSNFLTNSVSTIEAHPLKKLFDLGVKVTINSDDPEVLETNVNNEYRIAHEVLGMSMAEINLCNRFAFEASFIAEGKKQKIWDRYFA
ncbi:MAG: adenosine deaminase [Chloroflexi bacterium OLB14]|nr:MAG: adenosine deaminase [Chloroflexi bacterium OLB14]